MGDALAAAVETGVECTRRRQARGPEIEIPGGSTFDFADHDDAVLIIDCNRVRCIGIVAAKIEGDVDHAVAAEAVVRKPGRQQPHDTEIDGASGSGRADHDDAPLAVDRGASDAREVQVGGRICADGVHAGITVEVRPEGVGPDRIVAAVDIGIRQQHNRSAARAVQMGHRTLVVGARGVVGASGVRETAVQRGRGGQEVGGGERQGQEEVQGRLHVVLRLPQRRLGGGNDMRGKTLTSIRAGATPRCGPGLRNVHAPRHSSGRPCRR
jgi:hypothetical protein